MKSAIIATLAVSALTLTACATNKAPNQDVRRAHGHHHGADMKGHHHHMPVAYQCEDNTKVVAKYQPNADRATINVTAPSLSLDNQEIELKTTVSASGTRYLNDTNPASIYTWHIKGHDGVLSVKVDDKEYNYSCEVKHPRMPNDHHHH